MRWLYVIAAVVAVGAAIYWPMLNVASGFAAKLVCTGTYVQGRAIDDVMAVELAEYSSFVKCHEIESGIDCALFGRFNGRRAVFRGTHLGCTLLPDNVMELSPAMAEFDGRTPAPSAEEVAAASERAWPLGDAQAVAASTTPGLEDILDRAFADHDADMGEKDSIQHTRAVVVVQGGKIVGERYADGFDASTPLHGWSMTKTMVGMLIGMRVDEGALQLHAPAPVAEWNAKPGDPRANITLAHLLKMVSGLYFDESYARFRVADPAAMLFREPDSAAFAIKMPLAHEPGTFFSYASGTTNVLSAILRRSFDSDDEYLAYVRERLFEPLGMTSAFVETDFAGNLVFSSLGYATARDWARFGLFMAQDGVFGGKRLLSEKWVNWAKDPITFSEHDGSYGAQIRINKPQSRFENLPRDLVWAHGYEEQSVTAIPSLDLVIVRLGCNNKWNYERFLELVVEATTNAA